MKKRMTNFQHVAVLAILLGSVSPSMCACAAPVSEKRILPDEYFCDGINTGDFNLDGQPDIVAGRHW